MGLLDAFYSLSKNINKSKEEQNKPAEGVSSALTDELTLEMEDEQLIQTKNEWIKKWENNAKVSDLTENQKVIENYWKGKHFSDTGEKRPLADNLIFQAEETFLPLISRENPEPSVQSADNSEEGAKLSYRVQKMLQYQADRLKFKIKLQQVGRFWSLYMLGVAKIAWDQTTNDISLTALRPQQLILDPDGYIEGCEYKGKYIGEYRSEEASDAIKRFPEQKEFITEFVDGKLGTKITYIEWWTDEYMFWTLKDKVLLKSKNPHWNYEKQEPITDELGNTTMQQIPGKNHFDVPKKPFIFLSVFNLGVQPWDETNIILQNISLQDLVNKRLKQLDKNADYTNNGILVSGDSFDKGEASRVAEALRSGQTVWVPSGDVNRAVNRTTAPPMPNHVYETLNDYRNELQNIFGVRGVTPQGTMDEKTVRGKIVIKGQDADRMSLIVSHLEQFADDIYNWFVQLMYVYYDMPHVAAVLGEEKALEYIQLQSSDFTSKLIIGVSPGSMLPKDQLTKANQAIDLWSADAIDPISLYEMLDFPNPREQAMKLMLWKSNPMALFGGGQQPQQMQPGMPAQPQEAPTANPPEQQMPQDNQDILNQVPVPQ